jgi:hypothetical protein
MDIGTRRKVCELVTGIIATDRELHPSELKFMLKTFEAFGVARGGEDQAICPTVDSGEAARLMKELPLDLREEIVELLIQSAIIDGKIVPAEREFILTVGRAAGLKSEGIEERLAQTLLDDGPSSQIPTIPVPRDDA